MATTLDENDPSRAAGGTGSKDASARDDDTRTRTDPLRSGILETSREAPHASPLARGREIGHVDTEPTFGAFGAHDDRRRTPPSSPRAHGVRSQSGEFAQASPISETAQAEDDDWRALLSGLQARRVPDRLPRVSSSAGLAGAAYHASTRPAPKRTFDGGESHAPRVIVERATSSRATSTPAEIPTAPMRRRPRHPSPSSSPPVASDVTPDLTLEPKRDNTTASTPFAIARRRPALAALCTVAGAIAFIGIASALGAMRGARVTSHVTATDVGEVAREARRPKARTHDAKPPRTVNDSVDTLAPGPTEPELVSPPAAQEPTSPRESTPASTPRRAKATLTASTPFDDSTVVPPPRDDMFRSQE